MTSGFLGKDMLEHRKSFIDLPEEFFALLDPTGFNVVQEVHKKGAEYRCICQCKFRDRTAPFEAYITFEENVYETIVHAIDIESLLQGVN